MSTSGPRQADAVRRALEVTVDGEPLFTSVQSTWNVLEPSAGPALAEAAAAGARVIVKEAVANGRLAPGGADSAGRAGASPHSRPTSTSAWTSSRSPRRWPSRGRGACCPGRSTPTQVTSNAAAADLVLPDGVIDELATVAEDAHGYWATRASRPWS